MADVNPAPAGRRDRARATRLRMIHAAQKVFTSHGYAGARMIDVAAEAGVAVQTVYFTFHTKAELLQACYELAVLGEDDPRPPSAQPWYSAILAATDRHAAIRHFAEGNSAIAARVALLDDVVRSAAHEPDVDILLTLGGPATYRCLVADYGWPHDRFIDWLAATLSQQLLPA